MLAAQLSSQAPPPAYHVERQAVSGEAELVTIFGRLHAASASPVDVPLISVLRDDLGDPDRDNDRLRYVWILTSTPPTAWQRAASALSFAYFRAGTKQHSDGIPKPALDLAAPSKAVWSSVFASSLQALRLD